MKKVYLLLMCLLAVTGVRAASDGEVLTVERYAGLGYGTTPATVDFTAAKTFLGVETVTTDMLRIVNPDDSKISDYAPFDGWFNAEGVATTWGNTTAINVKFFQAIPEGTFTVCDMNGADVIGNTYTVKWALVNGENEYVYTINVTFVAEPVVEREQAGETLSVERYPGLGYTPTGATVDFTAAKAFLGVDDITTDMLRIVNPDGSLIAGYGGYDGWFAADGAGTNWADGGASAINVKFFSAIPGGTYTICDMNGADVIGTTYTVKWALVTDTKMYVYTINVTFVEKPAVALTYNDLTILDTKDVNVYSALGKMYEGLTADVDVASILATLGVSSLSDVTIYAVQSDNSLDDNYKLGTTDGWRNAAGDWQGWGDAAYFYVKADFAISSAQLQSIGGMEGKNTMSDWDAPATYTARYVFVNANKEAVELKVNLIYEAVAEVTVGAALYATYVAPADVTFEGTAVSAFAAQDKGTYVHLEPVTTVPAGTAVVVKADAAGTYTVKAATGAVLGTENDLTPATSDITADGTQYVLAQPAGEEVGFYQVTTGTTIAKGKGYLTTTAGVKALFFGEDVDAIEAIGNGQGTMDNAAIYNVAGQRMNNLRRGVNIVNGKKVVVK